MTLSLLAAIAIGTTVQDERPRIRETLPNGARILTQRDGEATSFAFALFCDVRGLADTPETHGHRHLLEHLMAPGVDGQNDKRLEAVGATLTASTTRDGMMIVVEGPVGKEAEAIQALRSVVAKTEFDQSDVDREVGILAEEAAVRPAWSAVDDAGWSHAFGGFGRSTAGDPDVLSSVTVEDLKISQAKLLDPRAVSMAYFGPMDASIALAMCRGVVESLRPDSQLLPTRSVENYLGKVRASGPGDGRTVIVPGVGSSVTTATVAVGIYLSQKLPRAQVVMPFSCWPSAVTLWSSRTGSLSPIDTYSNETLLADGTQIRNLALAWARGLSSTPARYVESQVVLLAQNHNVNYDTLEKQAVGLSDTDLIDALNSFKTGQAVEVSGR